MGDASIEISSEMLAAGVAALQANHLEESDSALVAAIYTAMARLDTRPRTAADASNSGDGRDRNAYWRSARRSSNS